MIKPAHIIAAGLIFMLMLYVFGSDGAAQVSESWVAHYNGESNEADLARDFELDRTGNIYAVGTSMSAGGGADIVTVSFDPDGGERWAERFNGTDGGEDWGYSIAIDSSGDLYVAGSSQSFETGKDFVIIKYNNLGGQLWVRYYNGPADRDDEAIQVEVDCAGNVVATGTSQSSDYVSDYATVKFSAQGDSLWAARYDGPGHNVDEARALAVDCDGNVIISGGSIGDSSDFDYATIKYDSDGEELWVARYDGPVHGYDVVYYPGSVLLDPEGNIYITGYSAGEDSSYDYYTVKYDPDGNTLWSDRYNGSQGNDYADALYRDQSGNLYVSGASYDSISSYDFLTIKYDPAGTILWTAGYNGTGNGWDEAYGIAVDEPGNVYIVGRSVGNNTQADFVTIGYSPLGEEMWSMRYDGSAHNFDWPFRIHVDMLSNVYVGGSSTETGHSSDYTVIKYEQTRIGVEDLDFRIRRLAFINQNYPNPFNSRTEIRYFLPEPGHVRLTVYNIVGQKVATLVDDDQQNGYHGATWNSDGESSGIYFYKLRTTNSISLRSMMLLK